MCCFAHVILPQQQKSSQINSIYPKFWGQLFKQGKLMNCPLYEKFKSSSTDNVRIEIKSSGTFLNFYLGEKQSSVSLIIDTGDQEESADVFKHLYADKENIEQCLGLLYWECTTNKRVARVSYFIQRGIKDKVNWKRLQADFLLIMTRFSDTFTPYISNHKIIKNHNYSLRVQENITPSFFHPLMKEIFQSSEVRLFSNTF